MIGRWLVRRRVARAFGDYVRWRNVVAEAHQRAMANWKAL